MCVLRIFGVSLDPVAALKDSTLQPYSVYRRGDLRFQKGESRHETSGIKVDVSKAEWTDHERQFEDALAFIRTHNSSLQPLAQYPGVEAVVLDFPFESTGRLTSVIIPVELAREASALNISLEISFYPSTEERELG